MTLNLEEVFKINGEPTYTFVEPSAYPQLLVALRTPGLGVVIEGPSGIGKSTAIKKALAQLGLADEAQFLSARKKSNLEKILSMNPDEPFGTVIIDDFHYLDSTTKTAMANLLKVLADEESTESKLILVGINRAGESLIQYADDLSHRISVVKFDVEPAGKVKCLITQGEAVYNVSLKSKEDIVKNSRGSFYLAQILSHKACLLSGLDQKPAALTEVATDYETVKFELMGALERRFWIKIKTFMQGIRFRAAGRSPYFHVLKWLSQSDNWTIDLREELPRHENERYSVSQILDKGYLEQFTSKEEFAQILHFDADTKCLTIEDPQLFYYLKNLEWHTLAKRAGFTNVEYFEPYDVALSFAGENREYAQCLFDELSGLGHAVFYDFNEQHRIIANDVKSVLAPIYESGSRVVAAILGRDYGQKRWPLFEKECYEGRLKKNQVIPIWDQSVPESPFDSSYGYGLLKFDPAGDIASQAAYHAGVISRALEIMPPPKMV